MSLNFEPTPSTFGNVENAISDTTGFTYEVHNKWMVPRGVGYAVFVRDCATGKSVTGNTAAFYTKSETADGAKKFCSDHNAEMNEA